MQATSGRQTPVIGKGRFTAEHAEIAEEANSLRQGLPTASGYGIGRETISQL